MSARKQQREKGFTIIEVVLVLAIAGLIFTMVFIALPALQKSQRDTQRKNDISRLVTAVTNYQSNNNGKLPSSWSSTSDFMTSYLTNGSTFLDPSGAAGSETTYNMTPVNDASSTPAYSSNTIYYNLSAICSTDDSSQVVASTSRKVAFRIKLEGGGVYCANN